MKIASVRIQNFRGFKDETVHFDSYTCLVGANGSGKSTVLAALNVFFRQYKDSKTDLSKLSADDFHHKDVANPIKITVTFVDLSEQATEDLADYVRSNQLMVSAVAIYDPTLQRAEVLQYGSRLGLKAFAPYFEAEKKGALVKDLQAIYEELGKKCELPTAKTKAAMTSALQEYERASPDKEPLESTDQFYGATKGANRLAPHIQWIFVPASKDITEEGDERKNSALGLLLARTIRAKVDFSKKIGELKEVVGHQYQGILDAEQSVLDAISVSIELKLKNWAHPDASAKVLWRQDPDKSVKVEEPWAFIRIGERGFEGELARFGHGMQRSCMLTLLQEIAGGADQSAPTLIMGIEEPELYQHPPQARYLADVLHQLSHTGSQIVVCSHSPLFIPGQDFEAVRVVREHGTPAASCVAQVTYDALAEKLNKCGEKLLKEEGMLAKLSSTLNPRVNEMFFCKVLILVEGAEDVAYLMSYLMLDGRIDSFRRAGAHIVPVGRKSDLPRPLAIAKLLGIPVYTIFDADTDKAKEQEIATHQRENKVLVALAGYPTESEWPSDHIWKSDFTVWKTNLTDTVQGEFGESWAAHYAAACASFSNPGGLEKNPMAIFKTLELAWQAGRKSECLLRLVEQVTTFAAGH
jgi:putative ATP-dependent endonuclease of OLD family